MIGVSKLIKTLYPFQFLSYCSPIQYTVSFLFLESLSLSISKVHYVPILRFSSISTALNTFDKLPQRSTPSDTTLFYHAFDLIRGSTDRPDLLTTLSNHCLALKVGALTDVLTSTSLLIKYSRVGDLSSSWVLFDEMLNKDVIAWNAMLTACKDNQCFQAAVDIFTEMMKEGSEFDSTTLLIIISALTQMNDMKLGRVIQCLSLKFGMDSDFFLSNALIDMYAKCRDLSSSEIVFAAMKFRDTTSWNSMIHGCLCNFHHKESLQYFREMGCSGERADYVSFSCAISACSSLGELGAGLVIHGLGIKLGYRETSNISVANSLISFYSHCGDLDAAETVFRGMIFKDVISWNSMLDGFAENGMILEAFDLLREMQLIGAVQPDSVTLVTAISLCAELNLLLEGRALHAFMIRREMGLDSLVINSLMDMYSKCNCVKSAEILFKAIPRKDLVSWNTLIAGYCKNGCMREAQNLFRGLLCVGPQCSVVTLLAILPSCDSPDAHKFGKLIHCLQLKLGFTDDVLTINAIMFMYFRCGNLAASFSLLQSILVVADLTSWNTFIVSCTQNGNFWKSLEVFSLMRRETHISPDSITLVSILSACGNLNLLFLGRLLHGLTVKTPIGSQVRVMNAMLSMYSRCRDIESASLVFSSCPYLNQCSWDCMISGLSQNKNGEKALELFRCFEFEPTEISIVSVLSACSQLGALRHGRQIHGLAFRFRYHWNSFVSAALVDMYSKCGRLDISIRIFQDSPEKSVASWNSTIAAYGFHSKGREAIKLFHEMHKSGTRATKSTFVSLLSACSHSGLIDEGYWYYNHMLDKFGVEPATEHHVCMVDMLGRAGKLNEAYEFIKQMQTVPASGVWGALLSSCNYHGDLEMGKQVAEHLFTLEPENVGYYVSLSNMYMAAGRWNDAMEVRRMIQDKRLKKPSGFSLIDVCSG
ncbi:pentatricopeptide repeat-containing protein At4g19220, mitochondrial [Macadamia integrifolia]|uniref:pentatricopeptide repeat-containing protein At4g19220, mitochondrial n=1 Tax=Macadamia integrifolia TaxID=60698 RepID=UPI001C500E77|nr:pentatricopeptide repeat-containing protein At4g19220, mitochondrial [Macadamia integrifolia]XP_042509536.1 pentatricopeptide repeat-containing protein At4g19220, mitochondrial [Macadamia integrifolia]XP_042509611.1 pentatricopeptide repeat-containing protein At4g19220, mitochondrial [Macadamia integrifolia]XP_042509686.1 pentatricopeptide repeat-containing protein At4g19220, mitochondrial [Macadamia integrifolia]XP_042509700.1 pentatricopeptide repeat-containing protein At4g19220, mitochond